MGNSLKIGWAEVDTTPEVQCDLCGQYYHRPSEGIHSRLSATALAFESAGEQVIMISLDLVNFQAAFQQELADSLDLPGFDVKNLFVNAIHTHSAPAVNAVRAINWLSPLPGLLQAEDYRKFLLEKLKQVASEAWNTRCPGGVASGFGRAAIGHCRRAVYRDGSAEMYGRTDRDDFTGMEAGEDSGVDLLFTYDTQEKPTGVIINVACPSQIMEATYLISSDFMGEIRRLLKDKYGSDFKTFGQISAAGCQSPRDLTRSERDDKAFWSAAGVAEIGQRLLQTIERTERKSIDFEPEFKHLSRNIKLPIRTVTKNEYKQALANIAELENILPETEAYEAFCHEVKQNEAVPERAGPYDSKLHHFVKTQNNKAVVARWELQQETTHYSFESHIMRLGDCVFATNPFELYLEFGQRIRARSQAAQTFIVQLSGDACGYLPGNAAEQLGGYGGMVINGLVGSNGGAKLVDETVKEINALFIGN
jgi:hypothetical protein